MFKWKAFWTMLKKTALFLQDGFPKTAVFGDLEWFLIPLKKQQ